MQKLVKRDYIHTLGYFARPMLCDWWLKVLSSRDGAASLKTFSNNSDATLTSLRGVRRLIFSLLNLDAFWLFRCLRIDSCRRASFFLPALKDRVSKGHDENRN